MTSESSWESFLTYHADAHLLQSTAWGKLKSDFGWQVEHLMLDDCGTQVLLRPSLPGFQFAYLPRGPVPADPDALARLLPPLDRLCRSRRVFFLKIEPDFQDAEISRQRLQTLGFQSSPHTVQPPRTILVNLQGTDDELLARMKPKTRYNIRLALRHGVSVSDSGVIADFARMMDITGSRDDFSVHTESYYRQAYAHFSSSQNVRLLLAKYQDRTVAGLMVFTQGPRAWYLYGASTDEHREVMAPYLLQWEAMQWARSRGCVEYDLWGIPDADEAALESQFPSRKDGLWGVYRFKRGFGGRVWRAIGAWDRVYNRPLYALYAYWIRLRSRRES